jgi:HSP20 family molecular chaperone IbpA
MSDVVDEYFRDMEEWAEQVRETLIERPCWDLKTCAIEPLREITVKPTEVIVTVDLPYAREDTVKVKPVNDSSIELFAELRRTVRLKELGVTHRKGEIQRFHGWINLPVAVNVSKMTIKHKKGILEIKLPRKRLQPIKSRSQRSLRT